MTQLRLALVLPILLTAAGCGGSPKRHFYTLQAPPPASERSVIGGPIRPIVEIDVVTLPEVVDRAQIVVRTSDHRLDISDTHRWAEPLKSAIANALAADLSSELGGLPVWVRGQSTAGEPDVRVSLDVLRFESVLDDAVTLEAAWMLRRQDGERPPVRRRSVAREAVQGGGYEALVAAHGRALVRIAREIAAAIRSEG